MFNRIAKPETHLISYSIFPLQIPNLNSLESWKYIRKVDMKLYLIHKILKKRVK